MADTLLLSTLGEEWQNAGVVTVLLLALSGVVALLDRLVITRLLFSSHRVPCKCRLCDGGASVGMGKN
jgi:hypothetical protein